MSGFRTLTGTSAKGPPPWWTWRASSNQGTFHAAVPHSIGGVPPEALAKHPLSAALTLGQSPRPRVQKCSAEQPPSKKVELSRAS
jgi:hypothetical protein